MDGGAGACRARPEPRPRGLLRGRVRRPSRRNGKAMFWATVSEGSRLNAWKTKPMRSRRRIVSRRSLSRPRSMSPNVTWPVVGRSSPGGHVQERALARTRRAHHGGERSCRQPHADPVEGDDRTLVPAVDLADVPKSDCGSRGRRLGSVENRIEHELPPCRIGRAPWRRGRREVVPRLTRACLHRGRRERHSECPLSPLARCAMR